MVAVENVRKAFRGPHGEVAALSTANLRVERGEFVVIRGPSGSGKTTLLLAIGGMQRPSEGRIMVEETDIYALGEKERSRFRAENIGFVFQMFHLVPYLNTLENVLMARTGGDRGRQARKAGELLDRLGLSGRTYHRPAELSAGERQRTAVARAMFNRPPLILADEPTGNLDPENATEVFEHLATYNKQGATVIVVTHGGTAEPYADRVIHLRDGLLER